MHKERRVSDEISTQDVKRIITNKEQKFKGPATILTNVRPNYPLYQLKTQK